MIQCCKCKRTLSKELFYWNGEPIGAVCAKRVGVITKTPTIKRKARKHKPRAPEIERDTFTLDLFDEA